MPQLSSKSSSKLVCLTSIYKPLLSCNYSCTSDKSLGRNGETSGKKLVGSSSVDQINPSSLSDLKPPVGPVHPFFQERIDLSLEARIELIGRFSRNFRSNCSDVE